MSEEEGLRAIVLAHGNMARGMVDAVRQISGVGEGILIPLSNHGKSPVALEAELESLLTDDAMVVFTDLSSGSCALAARKCAPQACKLVLVTGVNLAILLDFVFNRHLAMDELIPHLLKRGIASIQSIPEFPEHVDSPLSG